MRFPGRSAYAFSTVPVQEGHSLNASQQAGSDIAGGGYSSILARKSQVTFSSQTPSSTVTDFYSNINTNPHFGKNCFGAHAHTARTKTATRTDIHANCPNHLHYTNPYGNRRGLRHPHEQPHYRTPTLTQTPATGLVINEICRTGFGCGQRTMMARAWWKTSLEFVNSTGAADQAAQR
jgi:hypothetical protein